MFQVGKTATVLKEIKKLDVDILVAQRFNGGKTLGYITQEKTLATQK